MTTHLSGRAPVALLLLALILAAGSGSAFAGTTWDGGGGADTNWATNTNWDLDTLPLFNGTEVFSVNPGVTNRIMTLGAANRLVSRIGTIGNSSNTAGQDAVINSPGQSITFTSTTSTTALPQLGLASGDNAGVIFNNNMVLDAGAGGSFTAQWRQLNNAGFANQFNGTITQAAGQNWTIEFSQASARGTFRLLTTGNNISTWRINNATLQSGVSGALGSGAITITGGGTLGFVLADQFTTPVANSITLSSNPTINAQTAVRLTGSLDQNTRIVTFTGSNGALLRMEGAQVGAPTGETIVRSVALAVSQMNRLSNGTLTLGGNDGNVGELGVFVLGSGDVPTPADFAGARTYNQAGGANTWRLNNVTSFETGGGFAARNGNITLASGFAGLTAAALDRNISFGTAAQQGGTFYATGAVNLQQDITYTGTLRNVAVQGTALQTPEFWTLNGPVHEISGKITDPGSNFVYVLRSGSRLGTNGSLGGNGILRISNTLNSFSATSSIVIGARRGTTTLPSGRQIVSAGNSFDNGGAAVIFPDDAAFGNVNEVVVIGGGSSGARNGGLLLFENQGGGIKTFSRNFTIMSNDASSESGFGSYQGDVRYNGTVTLTETGDDENIHVHSGTFRLGQSGGPAATITNNRTAAATFIYEKGGGGTLALENVTFNGTNAVRRDVTIYEGAVRETGNAPTNSFLSGVVQLNGGVLEGNDATGHRPTITLGTAAGQLNWANNGFGGFSAFGGTYTIDIAPAGATTLQFTGNFARGTGGLLFGSQTADSLVNLIDNLDLQATTREVRVVDNPNSAGDVARLSGVISGTGGLTKTFGGVLELTGNNTYTGVTTVSGGTLRIDAENRLGANPGALAANQLTLNGGTLNTTATFAIDDSNRGVTLGASGGTIDVNGGTTLTVSNAVAGAGALVKTGSGKLILGQAGGNTYAGGTTVAAGTLSIANTSGSATGSGAVVVQNGATLAGTGTIAGSVNIQAGGHLAPGNSIGIIGSGPLTIAGVYDVELGTPGTLAAPGLSDRQNVAGTLTLSAGSTLNLIDNAGANAQGSLGAGRYQLLTHTGARTGTFTSVTGLPASFVGSLVYNAPGVGATDGVLLDVLNHGQASLSGAGLVMNTATDFTLNFGTVSLNSVQNKPLNLTNLLNTVNFTGGIDLLSVTEVGDDASVASGKFTTDLATFVGLPPVGNNPFTISFNTTLAGSFNADYQLSIADTTSLFGGGSLGTVTIHVLGQVQAAPTNVPEPQAAIAGATVLLAGLAYSLASRRRSLRRACAAIRK